MPKIKCKYCIRPVEIVTERKARIGEWITKGIKLILAISIQIIHNISKESANFPAKST